MHTEEALDAINFKPTADGRSHYTYKLNATARLADCPYFTTNLIVLNKPLRKDFSQLDSFVIYLCTEGVAAVKSLDTICPVHAGECVLVPAVADQVELFADGNASLLEVFVDPDLWIDDGTNHANDFDLLARFVGGDYTPIK